MLFGIFVILLGFVCFMWLRRDLGDLRVWRGIGEDRS